MAAPGNMSFGNQKNIYSFIFAISVILLISYANSAEVGKEDIPVSPEKIEYAKGSACQYCDYCKFCKLCKDCPCEISPSKPNCNMCKYCKYCNLCSAICNTICQPGGVLDRMSGAVVNSLPTSWNKEEVQQDIDKMAFWINKKKDEL